MGSCFCTKTALRNPCRWPDGSGCVMQGRAIMVGMERTVSAIWHARRFEAALYDFCMYTLKSWKEHASLMYHNINFETYSLGWSKKWKWKVDKPFPNGVCRPWRQIPQIVAYRREAANQYWNDYAVALHATKGLNVRRELLSVEKCRRDRSKGLGKWLQMGVNYLQIDCPSPSKWYLQRCGCVTCPVQMYNRSPRSPHWYQGMDTIVVVPPISGWSRWEFGEKWLKSGHLC